MNVIDSNGVQNIGFCKFNINHDIGVHLTKHGKMIYDDLGYRTAYPDYDIDGKLEIQAWIFMRIFGSHMYNGGEQIIKNNTIIVSDESL